MGCKFKETPHDKTKGVGQEWRPTLHQKKKGKPKQHDETLRKQPRSHLENRRGNIRKGKGIALLGGKTSMETKIEKVISKEKMEKKTRTKKKKKGGKKNQQKKNINRKLEMKNYIWTKKTMGELKSRVDKKN